MGGTSMPAPNPIERKTTRFGVKYGDFALVYERVVEKLKPVKQVETQKPKQLKKGGINIYV
jgi:hypothetical protein